MSDINSNTKIYGDLGLPFKQDAAGAFAVTGTILTLTGAFVGSVPVTSTEYAPLWVTGAATVAGTVAVSTTGFYARVGASTVLAASASWVVKASAGRVGKVSVIVSGTAEGYIHDTSTDATASGSNVVAVIPATKGVVDLGFPCAAGIVYIAGAGQTSSISFE